MLKSIIGNSKSIIGSGLEIHCYILMKYLNTSLSPALIIARAPTHFEEELLTSVIAALQSQFCTLQSMMKPLIS